MTRARICAFFLAFLFLVPLFSMSAYASGAPLETGRMDGGTTYATIPHADSASNERFVTAFTVGFMILLIIVCAFVMYYKR